MKKLILTLTLAASLLAACEGDTAKPPAAPPSSQPTTPPRVAEAPKATSQPEIASPTSPRTETPTPDTKATVVAEDGGQATPKPQRDRAAKKTKPARNDDSVAPKAKSRPADKRVLSKGSGVNHSLATPALFLRKLGLQPDTSGGWSPDSETEELFKQYHARHVVDNAWFGSPEAKGPYLAFDTRLQTDSADDARALARALATHTKREQSQGMKLVEFSDQVKLGDEGYAYASPASPAVAATAYMFVFRTDNVVSMIMLAGDKTYTRQQAMQIAEAADQQVSLALGR